MKRTTLTTLGLAAAVAVGYTVAPKQTVPGLPLVGEFATAYHDTTSAWLTFPPEHDYHIGVYKPYTDAQGRRKMVALFDPTQIELRVRPTHMMIATDSTGRRDHWYTARPNDSAPMSGPGERVEFYLIDTDSTYYRIETLAPCDTSSTLVERTWRNR